MDFLTDNSNSSDLTINSTTGIPRNIPASNFFSENYIIISISAVFISIFFIIISILLFRKIRERCSRQIVLDTYSSINRDDESIDDELDNCDALVYTSCKLYVGDDLGVDSDMTNSEPEYDCMSVDVSVGANESSVVDWSRNAQDTTEQANAHSLKISPYLFWRR